MLKLRDGVIELYRKAATSIPTDVENALKKSFEEETGELAKESLSIILQNISIARTTSRPLCQDTGFPVFYVQSPRGIGQSLIRDIIADATCLATEKIPLRANAVDVISDKNSNNNVGELFPFIHIDETEGQNLIVDLLLKGGGCENIGMTYKLPTVFEFCGKEMSAERDWEGVRKCVLDAVIKAQGKACPPYTLGIAVGGAKDQVSFLAKKQLMRRLYDLHTDTNIAAFEDRLLKEINSLGIGTAGLGGATTALGVKIGTAHRHPASYFVEVSFSCWALRRGRLVW